MNLSVCLLDLEKVARCYFAARCRVVLSFVPTFFLGFVVSVGTHFVLECFLGLCFML